jgi:hypothetical protein
MQTDTWQLIALSAAGCAGMAVQDAADTVRVRAIATGRATIAGLMDAGGDLAKFVLLSFSGVQLMTNYGWKGRWFLLPILLTGFLVTYHATNLSERIEDEDENREDDTRDGRIQALEAKVDLLERRLKEHP